MYQFYRISRTPYFLFGFSFLKLLKIVCRIYFIKSKIFVDFLIILKLLKIVSDYSLMAYSLNTSNVFFQNSVPELL